ncbi:MAG: 1-phosphofructokinase family hexose kinase [Desulfobacterales bacterium]
MQIVTFTMNPAIDKSSAVGHVVADRKIRCRPPVFEPGGGGINVSRAIARLGGKTLAVYPSGGPPGDLFKSLLDAEGLNHHPLPIDGFTRENLMIYEEYTQRQFRFGMPGPEMTEKEWRMCLDGVFELDSPEFLVASGSLPKGVPDDFFGQLARKCSEAGAQLIVDTSGEALVKSVQEGLFLIKPNMTELRTLAGEDLEDESRQEAFARSLIDRGRSRYVVISLGAAGVLAASPEGIERVRAPAVKIQSKVGAGDSTVAGITLKLAQGRPFMDAVRYGVAAGAAAVMTPGSELCRLEDVEALYAKIKA